MATSVLLVGVGGQGIISAAQVLADAALSTGYDVKTSEVHGMAQRGGSVQSMVRWGKEVFSPLIPEGQADFILAFEMLEGLRYVRFLSPGGLIVMNRVRIDPLPVLAGAAEYPAGIDELLAEKMPGTMILDAADVGAQAGNRRAAGAAMLGALATKLEFSPEVWENALRHNVPKKALEANLKAFDLALHLPL
ncbi:MAG: indolepyruvate oxidoreductase subunit beta [Actinobacteria bacterium]|nr:indolepyruvate oxidoreductase subunit beta [Actinomycetota bacterium]